MNKLVIDGKIIELEDKDIEDLADVIRSGYDEYIANVREEIYDLLHDYIEKKRQYSKNDLNRSLKDLGVELETCYMKESKAFAVIYFKSERVIREFSSKEQLDKFLEKEFPTNE